MAEMELFRALACVAEAPEDETQRVADALGLGPLPSGSEYTETFLFQLYPYASVYLGAEGMMGGEARDRIAGFWRALQQTPPAEPDHLAVMLALYAQLTELETEGTDALRKTQWRQARKAFLWEHLVSWLPVYLKKLDDVAPAFYRHWGAMLREALYEEMERVGAETRLSMHLREPLGLADPREKGTEEFLQSLLAPVRSGMILTRADLARAARRLNLGLRLGERRFILRALFSQDARAVLEWLGEEASMWEEQHRQNQERVGAVAAAWRERAANSAALLEELKISATGLD